MKSLVYLGVFALLVSGALLVEQYARERCKDHSGVWVERSWYQFDGCEFPAVAK